jgi:hypothetical protein
VGGHQFPREHLREGILIENMGVSAVVCLGGLDKVLVVVHHITMRFNFRAHFLKVLGQEPFHCPHGRVVAMKRGEVALWKMGNVEGNRPKRKKT